MTMTSVVGEDSPLGMQKNAHWSTWRHASLLPAVQWTKNPRKPTILTKLDATSTTHDMELCTGLHAPKKTAVSTPTRHTNRNDQRCTASTTVSMATSNTTALIISYISSNKSEASRQSGLPLLTSSRKSNVLIAGNQNTGLPIAVRNWEMNTMLCMQFTCLRK